MEQKRTGAGRWLAIFFGLVIGFVLLAVAAIWVITRIISNTAQQALEPVQQANSGLRTQVAEFLNPTPTIVPDPATIIHDVRSLARLETIQYSIEKVITAETNQNAFGFLFGDRLLFVAHGVVIAGVDMAKIRPEDMMIQGEALYVRLPPAEVFVATLDNEKSYVYDRDTGLLNQGERDLETSARQAAEDEILQAAIDDGILDTANLNAENYMSRMFRGLGFDEVIFLASDAEMPQPLPTALPTALPPTPMPAATP